MSSPMRVTRTVTETDNVLVSALTHNPQPMHLDHEVAAASEFGKPLVNSIYTFGLMVGVSVSDTTLGTLVANLGYDKLDLPRAGVRRRHAEKRKRVPRGAGKQVAAQRRHRHLGASQLQPARRAGVQMHPLGAAPEEAGMSRCAPPPRSWLFVPADSNKKMMKALESEADAVIFDLEDSVAPAQKPLARELLACFLSAAMASPSAGSGSIRSAPTITHDEDLDALDDFDIDGIVLPKAECGDDVDDLCCRARPAQPADPRHRHRNRGLAVRPA